MALSDHQKQVFRTFLSGERHPFPDIYDAISEQILLLIFKARHLYTLPECRHWFEEQHRVITALQDQSAKISEIYKSDNYAVGAEEEKEDPLLNTLAFMRTLYEGFDKGNVSLKTWGEMNHPPEQRRGRYQHLMSLHEEFIRDDLFAILTSSQTGCPAIPVEKRKGYCHQDLSIAHSHGDLLLEKLDKYFSINRLDILSETVFHLIADYRQKHSALPQWLTPFADTFSGFAIRGIRESHDFKAIKEDLEKQGCEQLIDSVITQGSEHDAQRILNVYIGVYATDIHHWLFDILRYLKTPQSTPYRWKFTTISPDRTQKNEEKKEHESISWDSEFCQITIDRNNLLELIQTHTLYDAVLTLADRLLHIYRPAAEQELQKKDSVASLAENEQKIHNSNSFLFPKSNRRSYEENVGNVQMFEAWHQRNTVLLISKNIKRTEKITVAERIAGLKSYDLKIGIPSGSKMKVKDGVYDKVKSYSFLKLPDKLSQVSLQRYHSKAKAIINAEIDMLLHAQQNKNAEFPFNGATHAIKPLWAKCDYANNTEKSEL